MTETFSVISLLKLQSLIKISTFKSTKGSIDTCEILVTEPLPSEIRENYFAYLATFLLDSLLPALDREIEQQENGQEEKKDRGKRHHLLVFLLSPPPPSVLYLLVEDPD